MNLRPDEIAAILKTEIERYGGLGRGRGRSGTVIQIGDGIARIYGLDRCMAMERLEFEHGVVGLALNLEEDNVAAVLFGDSAPDQGGRHRAPLRQGDVDPGR